MLVALSLIGLLPAGADGRSAHPGRSDLTVIQSGQVPLYPGAAAESIRVTLNNPTSRSILYTSIGVSVKTVHAPGCQAGWFRTTAAAIPAGGVAVPPGGVVMLPAQGATAPSIQMIESGTNQDACKGAELELEYSARAIRPGSGPGAEPDPGPGGEEDPSQASEGAGGGGKLPFTGLAVWAMAAAGVMLMLSSAAFRRFASAFADPAQRHDPGDPR